MTHPLQAFLKPKSIALVGATERSVWSNAAYRNIVNLGFEGAIHVVNRRGGTVYGKTAATTLGAIGEPVDVALLMVPSEALPDAMAELGAAGIGNAVLLSSGFAEAGPEGRAQQDRLQAEARKHGVRLLGPNCLGFVNFVDRAAVWTTNLRDVLPAGSISVVSQSGNIAGQMCFIAQELGSGLAYMVSTGNEADIGIGEVIDFFVDDPHTRAIAVFAETVRDTARFMQAAKRALAAEKPIIILKVGASEITAKAAQAHTGSLVGDHRVFEAVCRRLGLMQADSVEDLVVTADFVSRTGPFRPGGLAVVSMSGGMCEIAADLANAKGLPLATLTTETLKTLSGVLPGYGTSHNPLDITGAAVLRPAVYTESLLALAIDPGISALIAVSDVGNSPANATPLNKELVVSASAGLQGLPMPSLMVSHFSTYASDISRRIILESGVNYLPCGLEKAISAAARIHRWSERLRAERERGAESRAHHKDHIRLCERRPLGERETLEYLGERGIPVIPARLARNRAEAVEAARKCNGPVVLKVSSPGILHKTEAGGVLLNLNGDQEVENGYAQIMERSQMFRPDAHIEGVLVAPMRKNGMELFVGTMHDAQWGAVLVVGLGGIWVEALKDTSLRVLPVDAQDVKEMLSELRGSTLLNGFRGTPGVDQQAVAETIAAIGNAALALGPDLVSLEVNPLYAADKQVEALDALTVWRDAVA